MASTTLEPSCEERAASSPRSHGRTEPFTVSQTKSPSTPDTPGFSFSETPPTSPSIDTPQTQTDSNAQAHAKGSSLKQAAVRLLKRGHSRRTSTNKATLAAPSTSRDSDSLSSSSSSTTSAAHQRTREYTSFFQSIMNDASDTEDENCPVCLEPLKFRLAGEKPHVVPVCGHRLHDACFEAVYGGLAAAKAKRGGALGLCGVCRRDMKVGGDDGGSRKNKFAALSGLPTPSADDNFKLRSVSRGTLSAHDSCGSLHDPNEDDEIVPLSSPFSSSQSPPETPRGTISTWGSSSTMSSRPSEGAARLDGYRSASQRPHPIVVRPIVTVQAEHETITRPIRADQKEHLTCLLSIAVPHRWPTPSFVDLDESNVAIDNISKRMSMMTGRTGSSQGSGETKHSRPAQRSPTGTELPYGNLPPLPEERAACNDYSDVVRDLRSRMVDWKGHTIDEFGALRLHDYLKVRKDTNVREFRVCLFEEAILCISDDQRREAAPTNSSPEQQKKSCRLKGRVYVRHIQSITDTSSGGELSLTISMSDDSLDEFVMTFDSPATLKKWKRTIEQLVLGHSDDQDEKHRSLGGKTVTRVAPMYHHDDARSSHSHGSGSSSQDHSGKFTQFARLTEGWMTSPPIPEDDTLVLNTTTSYYSQMMSPSSDPAGPRTYTPLDLMLVISVPPLGTSALKLDIIKSTLDFIVDTVGPRTRLSLVTFTAGEGARGMLRKTPLISLGRSDARARLDKIISEIGREDSDSLSMIEHKEERVNVVTAVNLALDVVLQRSTKSSLTGIVLVNDSRDGAQKAQMDLVMARADAADVPIHTVGWGKTHDPSSLWLLSNHTGGTYTFAKDFYDLRDCMAGIIGGLLSIAINQAKLHISVPDNRYFKIRKVAGIAGAIISSDGKDVDIELGELRFGEKRDLLVEVEVTCDTTVQKGALGLSSSENQTATEAFFTSMTGLDPSALGQLGGASLYDDEYDSMPEEVAVFEVTVGYRDPLAKKVVSHLSNTPSLLTVTVNPSQANEQRATSSQAKHATSPDIVKRRIELLVSDMLTKSLLFMSRRSDAQAVRILQETKRIVSTIMTSLAPPSQAGPARRGDADRIALATLAACMQDVNFVLEGCSQRDVFDLVHRNYAAQQAVVLREQQSWTARSPIERAFFVADNAVNLVQKSQGWISTRMRE